MAAILRRYYGPRSEKFDPKQLLLFGEQIDQQSLDDASIAEEAGETLVTRRIRHRDRHGRQQLPEHLERIEIEHDVDNKACPACGHERCWIGQEVSEQLEHFPASFKVLRHIRHKYACGNCNHEGYDPNIVVAKKPPQPIEKGLPGPSLLAYVIMSKPGDHLPLYRLERIFERQQVRHHVDPQRYLTSVFAKVGSTPAEELEQFFPDVLGREDKAEPVPTEK